VCKYGVMSWVGLLSVAGGVRFLPGLGGGDICSYCRRGGAEFSHYGEVVCVLCFWFFCG
jgi:hypothetical protein